MILQSNAQSQISVCVLQKNIRKYNDPIWRTLVDKESYRSSSQFHNFTIPMLIGHFSRVFVIPVLKREIDFMKVRVNKNLI